MCAISNADGTGFSNTRKERFNHSLVVSASISAVRALVAETSARN